MHLKNNNQVEGSESNKLVYQIMIILRNTIENYQYLMYSPPVSEIQGNAFMIFIAVITYFRVCNKRISPLFNGWK